MDHGRGTLHSVECVISIVGFFLRRAGKLVVSISHDVRGLCRKGFTYTGDTRADQPSSSASAKGAVLPGLLPRPTIAAFFPLRDRHSEGGLLSSLLMTRPASRNVAISPARRGDDRKPDSRETTSFASVAPRARELASRERRGR